LVANSSEAQEVDIRTLLKDLNSKERRVPVLIEKLKYPVVQDRRAAAKELGEIGGQAKAAVPALIEALKDSHLFVCDDAAEALGKIGREAKAAIPSLIETLQNTSYPTPNELDPFLNKSANMYLRASSAKALGMIGLESKIVAPALILALKDKDYIVRNNASNALLKLGKDAVPLLIVGLNDENIHIRYNAANILAKIATILNENSIDTLVEAHNALKNHNQDDFKKQAKQVQEAINYLKKS